jgi:glutathione S-transferase
MLRCESGWATPEDFQAGLINRNPHPEQLEVNDYVDRSRRMHRMTLKTFQPFWPRGCCSSFPDRQ